MTPQDKIIILSAKIQPSIEELELLDAQLALVTDWDAVVLNVIERGLGPLFYTKLEELRHAELIPPESKQKLKQSYYKTLSQGMIQYNVFRRVASLLQSEHIAFIVLKGAYLSEKLYKNIALRQFSDFDLLIREKDGERAQQLLKGAGFKSNDYPMAVFLRQNVGFEHYPPLVYKGVPIELHVRLNKPTEKFQLNTELVWEHAETVTLQGFDVQVPDFSDLLIHTCVHLHKHFQDGHIQFTGVNDIVNLLQVFKDKINWELLQQRCGTYGCEEIVFKYLMLTVKFYQIELPKTIVKKYERCLLQNDEAIFMSYMSGYSAKHFSVASSFKVLKKLEGIGLKFKYVIWMLFPTKENMIKSYEIKNPSLYWCYYPYRYWIAIKGLWRMIFNG